jgi:surface protein
MFAMFFGCSSFNGDISTWNVSNVTNMSSMFENATNFNQPLNSWIVSTVTNMPSMFQNASNLAIVNCRYQFDQTECKRYPQKLVELCAWLLAQNPDDRPSAVQLKSILDEWDARIDDPLLLPRQVMDRIEKDARLYGIPRSVGRQKDKEAVQAAVAAGDAVWTRSESSATNGWEANFSNLIDIHHEKEAAPTESFSIPDLLG